MALLVGRTSSEITSTRIEQLAAKTDKQVADAADHRVSGVGMLAASAGLLGTVSVGAAYAAIKVLLDPSSLHHNWDPGLIEGAATCIAPIAGALAVGLKIAADRLALALVKRPAELALSVGERKRIARLDAGITQDLGRAKRRLLWSTPVGLAAALTVFMPMLTGPFVLIGGAYALPPALSTLKTLVERDTLLRDAARRQLARESHAEARSALRA